MRCASALRLGSPGWRRARLRASDCGHSPVTSFAASASSISATELAAACRCWARLFEPTQSFIRYSYQCIGVTLQQRDDRLSARKSQDVCYGFGEIRARQFVTGFRHWQRRTRARQSRVPAPGGRLPGHRQILLSLIRN